MAYDNHNNYRDSERSPFRSSGRREVQTVYSVQDALKKLLGNDFAKLESGSLRLNKMLKFSSDPDKKNELESICKCINNGKKDLPAPVCNVPGLKSFRMKLAGRMMINQSGSVLNLGILLHRNFSCPYIPGSALKGVTRHYAKQYHGETEDFLRIFGQGEFAGSVAFMNAFPSTDSNGNSKWKMVVDVLTKHNDPDAEVLDTRNPTPIFFPAVDKGAIFTFSVAPAKTGSRTADNDVALAATWLKNALKEWGVGAKTSAGYGWFKEA